MKWFKHYENAHTNQFIQALLMERNGHELYACWFLLLELLCKEFKKDTQSYTLSIDQIAQVFHVKYSKKAARLLQDLVEFSARFEQDLLNVEQISEKFYKIQTPIILELMGKDFKRTRQRGGNATAKKKEERIKNKNTQETAGAAEIVESPDLEAAYKNYPRKMGKKKGMQKLQRQIKTPEQYANLCKAINNYALHCEKSQTDQQYIKHFSTFVGEWEDWIELPDDAIVKTEEEKMLELMQRFDSGEFDVC
jgi:ribosomal protein S15P/S13E